MTSKLLWIFWMMVQLSLCYGSATLEMKMVTYYNTDASSMNGTPCETILFGECDHLFTFCLDELPSNNQIAGQYCSLLYKETGEFNNDNIIDFGQNMRGVPNPLVLSGLDWKALGGKVRYKMDVWDEDDEWNPDEHIDSFFQDVHPQPATNNTSAEWQEAKYYGIRSLAPSPSQLYLHIRLYCDPPYLGPFCDCHPQDSDSLGHFTCDHSTGLKVCLPGWMDPDTDCKTSIDDCADHSCQNGGTCLDGHMTYTCACTEGYQGPACEEEIDECLSDPCQHEGACVDDVGSYVCICDPSYLGPNCEYHICDSSTICQNGGSCDRTSGDCVCAPGYDGHYCQTPVCDSIVCQNDGVCDPTKGKCTCTEAYIGLLCQYKRCDFANCQNNATCVPSTGDCQCQAGFTGRSCELRACDFVQCQHGSCDLATATCSCDKGYSGFFCDKKNGLEAWQVALIVIGVILVCVLLCLMAYWFIMRKRKPKPSTPAITAAPPQEAVDISSFMKFVKQLNGTNENMEPKRATNEYVA